MIFEKVELPDILKGVKDFEEKGYPEGFKDSRTFEVIVEGKAYPPKPIMAYADFYATGNTPVNDFYSGYGKPCFNAFQRIGIQIVQQCNPKNIPSFIDQYKQLITDGTDLKYNELYKWETFQHFKENWVEPFDATSIVENIKNAFNQENNNLWSGSHFLPYKAIKDFAEREPKKVAEMFMVLFDENKPLAERCLYFETEAEKLQAKYYPDKNWDHYQDIRAMMVYLSLRFPNKYYLYKNRMFNDFCKISKFWSPYGSATKKDYTILDDYQSMCDALKNELLKDGELIRLHENRIPDEINIEDDYNLLVQDFIYSVSTYLNPKNNQLADEERLIQLLTEIGLNDADLFYQISEKLLTSLNVTREDERVSFNLPKNRLIGITIGQRYCINVEIKRKKSLYHYIDNSEGDDTWYKEAESLNNILALTNTIIASAKKELDRSDKTSYRDSSSPSLEKSLFDLKYRSHIFSLAFDDFNETNSESMESNLNQIFFGPPGTGKTYNTINEAIKITDPDFYKEHVENREKLKERFKLLLLNQKNDDNGQIGFTTFHQSFSYEDFVEGIKPIEPTDDDTFLKYKIQEGIFKKICRLANDSLKAKEIKSNQLVALSNDEFDNSQFYKMSLGDSQKEEDQEIFDYCAANNCITIGFGNSLDFTGKDERGVRDLCEANGVSGYSVQAMNYFKNYLKVGNYVVISNGNHYVRAIGKVTGEYEYREESPFVNNSWYNHFRAVEWIFNDKEVAAKELYHKNLSQQTIYKLIKSEIKKEFFVKAKTVDPLNLPKNPKNFVLVVDEINRGNVSSIFGELITLIEKDKRAGGDEELSVILPYSKKEFKVPQNVYIIGTMNTADRSIEALDTALRRRFSFREMPPKPHLIKGEGKLKDREGKIGDLNLVTVLETINNRIEKLIDKDHKIGHSYFLKVDSIPTLTAAFKNEVIPLLEEYFFGDFGKIGLVLGASFIAKKKDDAVKFATFEDYDPSIANDLLEKPVYVISDSRNWDFKAIYE
tara:strand:- start:3462 stop:6464 length:3003 start_codon:yes stop_codon:yes gene_type:complete